MAIQCIDLVKEFGSPPQRILHGLNFEIQNGEFVAISGRSGSGKSTLLYLLSTLDVPSSGKVVIDDYDVTKISSTELHDFRNQKIGFIFQFHYLLPELTAIDNVLLPARRMGKHNEFGKRALELLDGFGIPDKAHKYPSQLSGGEQQRVAIARALLLNPRYIFADEPTGNLDLTNGQKVMDILLEVNRKHATTLVLVTHEPDFASLASREIYLVDGRIRA